MFHIPSDVIQRLNIAMTFGRNLTRQQIAQQLIDYYEGLQLSHLDDVLKAQFADVASLKLQKSIDNIVQFIADETSRVFDQPPALTCEDANGKKLIDYLMENKLLWVVWQTAEVYSKLNGICAITPWFDDVHGVIKQTILPSSVLFVAQREDDPTEPESVIYARRLLDTITGMPRIEYVHWDKDFTFLFDNLNPGVYRPPSDSNPEMKNPYGILPFAFLRDQAPIGQFFPESDEVLLCTQDNLNVILTEINQLAKFQSFSQPVLTGIDPNSNIAVDPSRPIRIPPAMRDETPGDFKFVTPQARIVDLLTQAEKIVENICSRRGIAMTGLKQHGTAQSGYALKIQNQRLDRRRLMDLPLARNALCEWFCICRAIYNAHGLGPQVSETAELGIHFHEPDYADDPTVMVDNDLKRLDMGVVSPIELMMRDNPDLDEDSAKAKYEENLQYRQQIKSRFGLASLLAPSNPGQAPKPPKGPQDTSGQQKAAGDQASANNPNMGDSNQGSMPNMPTGMTK